MVADDERAEIQEVRAGYLMAISPKTAEYMRALSANLGKLTSLQLTPPVVFYAVADAINDGAVPEALLGGGGGWGARMASKDFLNAVANHILLDQIRFESLREVTWRDSRDFVVAVVGPDEARLREYAKSWSEESSPLDLHHSQGSAEVSYADGQLQVSEEYIGPIQRLAEELSARVGKPINLRQALYALVQDNLQVSENPLSAVHRRVRFENVLSPDQVARCAGILEREWHRYSEIG
jgi:hypothetical protein